MSVIGIFDSGVGGLSVLRAIRAPLGVPHADLIYFGDNAHIPYGPRPLAEGRAFSEGITRFLLDQGAQVIGVACHTAPFQGELFNSGVERFAQGGALLRQVYTGQVAPIEVQDTDSPETEAMLRG